MKFKSGDKIKAIDDCRPYYIKGVIYVVYTMSGNEVLTIRDSAGILHNGWDHQHFVLVKDKPKKNLPDWF